MAFPSNIQFIPIRVEGVIPSDPAGDVTPGSMDIVGDAQFPPAYFAYDGQNVYFRLRLQGDPRSNTSFQNLIWGVLLAFDGDLQTYQWMFAVDGGRSWIALIQNRIKGGAPLTDLPEGSDGGGFPNFHRPINNFDLARARVTDDGSSFGGSSNYFLDFFVDTGTFFSQLVINASTPVRLLFFTSTTTRQFDKDSLPFSDPVTFNQANVRASLQAQETLVAAPSVILTGETVTLTAKLAVSNAGSSGALAVFATLPFESAFVAALNVDAATLGNANYNTSTGTLSWNIGNLASGQSAELTFAVTAVFMSPGMRNLNSFAVSGIDQFTGNTLPTATGAQQVSVQASGGVSGIVQNAASGQVLQGVTVQLLPGGVATATGGDGGYGLTGVAPGSYSLQFSLPDFAAQQIPVTIAPQQSLNINALLAPLPSSIRGIVTSAADGAPIGGAVLLINNSVGAPIAETTTASDGSYAVSGLPAGKLQISVGAEGFQLSTTIVTTFPGAESTFDIVLPLASGGVVGVVADAAGLPIAGATVTLLNEQTVTQVDVTTDAAGQYSLLLLVPGIVYLIRAAAPGFAASASSVRIQPGATATVNFALAAAPGSLSGVVTESQVGQPLASASVQLADVRGLILQTAATDAAGRFGFDSLASGAYTLLVNSAGFANLSIGAIVQSGQNTDVAIQLIRQSGTIGGRVFAPGGLPIANAEVSVSLNGAVIIRTITDADGIFFIPSLYPQTYLVAVVAEGFAAQSLGVLVEPLLEAALDFALVRQTGSLSGFITDASGGQLAGAVINVRVNFLSITTQTAQVLSDDNGLYSLAGLLPGQYTITVSLQGFQNAIGVVAVRELQNTELSFALLTDPGRIEGLVLDDRQRPITDVTVSVIISSTTGSTVSSVFAGNDGRYASEDLAPGFYMLLAKAAGFRADQVTRQIGAGQTVAADIMLVPLPGAVQGTITDDRTGAPVPGATVKALTQNGVGLDAVLTDNKGFYRLEGLRPGGYSIIASSPAYEYLVVGAVVLADTVTQADIRLSQLTGDLAGIVEPPIAGVLIQLYTDRNALLDNAYTEADGSFRFTVLRAGNYVLLAEAADYSSDPAGLAIVPGQTAEAAIRLVPNPGVIQGSVRSELDQPITNATILVLDRNETVRGIGQTGDFGAYAVGNLPQGTLSLVVSAPGFGNALGAVNLAPGAEATGIDFVLIANSGGIGGLITDADTGAVIASAQVEVRLSDASGIVIAFGATSEFGEFVIDDLRPASYAVLAFAPGYASRAIGAIVQSDVRTSAFIGLNRLRGAISGTIRGQGGARIAANGTFVKLFTSAGTLIETLFADNEGHFAIADLAPNTYVVSVSAIGFIAQTQTVYLDAGQTAAVDFVLFPQVIGITGKVLDADTGKPVAGALIGINGRIAFPIETLTTDNNGEFAYDSLPFGRLTLFASAVGYGAASAAINPLPGKTIRLVFRLQPDPGTVFGFVTDFIDGTALAGAEIKLFDRSQVQLATVLTDNNGMYAFSELAQGDYLSIASFLGFASSQGGFTIAPGQATKYSFALQPLPGSLTGTVTDIFGNPIQDAAIVLRPLNNFAAPLAVTTTNGSGVYLLDGLSVGNYTLNLAQFGFETKQSSLYVGQGERVVQNFVLQATPAIVEGIVTEAESGRPIENALVTGIDSNGIIIGQGVTDIEGLYSIGTGSEAQLWVIAVKEGFQFGETSALLAPGQRVSLDLTLARGPSFIRGTTRNAATGSPISGVVLSVLTLQHIVIESISSDGDGAFAFNTLAPGTYFVSATSPFYGSTSRLVTVARGGSVDLVFELSPVFGGLKGTIRDSAGNPLNLALVEIFLKAMKSVPQARGQSHARTRERFAAGKAAKAKAGISALQQSAAQPANGIFMRSSISAVNGAYTISNLPPGMLIAGFSFPEKMTALREPVIIAGQFTLLDIVLEDEEEE